ncbi:MAG: hypothetical protein CVV64_09250 [Candidatus Wallbacteria bacterium HGW-Wallbacteria-1]|jgi:stage V sporulation protein D (sporulation-specific penicillin-binding protein)|uniref:PASTA domain-containing protein n=1 Tax=Candidatus Wallbacteria bacterium HGW-Wallbacteria-1 TaxID=2013854 RepID=A0A2N1PQB7_9BACT|nr:MAG: hypothetical protein CVV64_09250 [Candidatus Wallbacteria bacterium HGW-Wallbacteria-1]
MQNRIRERIYLFSLLVILMMAANVARLFYVQLIDSKRYTREAEGRNYTAPLDRRRGVIYDRNMRELAISHKVNSLYAVPREIDDLKKTIESLSNVFGKGEAYYLKRLTANRNFVWLERKIDEDRVARINDLKLKGLRFKSEYKRVYPGKNLASNLIGFVGMDNDGLEGLELYFDKILASSQGRETYYSDPSGARIPLMKDSSVLSPKGGNHVILTLDEVIQHIVEEEIEKVRVEYDAKQAFGIVNDPTTGEILAMANVPNYDLNDFSSAKTWVKKNRCITDVYEPGSTFKIISSVASLEDGKVNPGDYFDCPGYVMIGGHRLRCHLNHGHQTFAMGIAESCNVAIIRAVQKVGKNKLFETISRFGIGEKTGLSLPGESRGIVHPVRKWAEIDLGAIAIGQAISVTPIQLMTAVSAVVNDGVYIKPRVVREIHNADGEVVVSFKPEAGRRVCSLATSKTIRGMLSKVVSIGTGKGAAFINFEVGGKTGTAQKAGPGGKYDPDKVIASFVGFIPIERPKFGILVVVDEPKGEKTFGGIVAAKAFKAIGERILEYLGYYENDGKTANEGQLTVPDFRGKSAVEILEILEEKNYNLDILGSGDVVGYQYPLPGSKISDTTPVAIYFTDPEALEEEQESGLQRMPFVLGKTLKQVLGVLKDREISVRLNGSGVAYRQKPVPGEIILANTECQVEFKDE